MIDFYEDFDAYNNQKKAQKVIKILIHNFILFI